jgi:hypothetical protein
MDGFFVSGRRPVEGSKSQNLEIQNQSIMTHDARATGQTSKTAPDATSPGSDTLCCTFHLLGLADTVYLSEAFQH